MDELNILVKKTNLYLHLWWNRLYYGDPNNDPSILSRRPKNGPLISLRTEEYARYYVDQEKRTREYIGGRSPVFLEPPGLPLRPPLQVLSENTRIDPGYLRVVDELDVQGTLNELRRIIDYGEELADDDGEEEEEEIGTSSSATQANKENIVPSLPRSRTPAPSAGTSPQPAQSLAPRTPPSPHHHLKNLIWLRDSIIKNIEMLRNHSVERAVSRMTLNSDPLDDGIIYAEELPKEEMHVMSAMEIPGLIESHGETGPEKEISLRLHVVREQSLGRISSFISTLPTVGRYLEGAISVPSRNPDFFKTVINDVSLNAALIANGKEEKEVDRGRLNADLTKMNDYERLVRRQEVVLRRVRGRNSGVKVSDIEDIIGSYEQGPGV